MLFWPPRSFLICQRSNSFSRKVGTHWSRVCLIQIFNQIDACAHWSRHTHKHTHTHTHTSTTSEGWDSVGCWGVGCGWGIKLWTTCFCHLGHILHDWAKCFRLDTHDNIQAARPEREPTVLAGNVCSTCKWVLPPVVSPSMSLTLISSSKQTERWQIRIEGFNEE